MFFFRTKERCTENSVDKLQVLLIRHFARISSLGLLCWWLRALLCESSISSILFRATWLWMLCHGPCIQFDKSWKTTLLACLTANHRVSTLGSAVLQRFKNLSGSPGVRNLGLASPHHKEATFQMSSCELWFWVDFESILIRNEAFEAKIEIQRSCSFFPRKVCHGRDTSSLLYCAAGGLETTLQDSGLVRNDTSVWLCLNQTENHR